MSILADNEIKELCSPNRYLYKYNSTLLNGNVVQDQRILSLAEDVFLTRKERLGPDESLEPASPMISPFVDHQAKVEWQHISSVELEQIGGIPAELKSNDLAGLLLPDGRWIRRIQRSNAFLYEVGQKIISYGLSSFGYDLRIAPEFKVFTNVNSTLVDPKNFDNRSFVDIVGDSVIIPPNSFVLARSLECFDMPNDVCGIVIGKSTYARVGVHCLCTPLEPGWKGHLTLEFANTTPLPVKLYANEGGCQVMFFRGKRPDVTYGDRLGKYQDQAAEIVLPKV